MRLRLVDLGASISALCCRSQIGLVLGSALKNCIDGNPKNIHIRFNSESHPPVERHGLPKGMVRLRSTGSFHQKECFDYFCDFDASVCRWYRARLTRSAIQDAIDARPANAKLAGNVHRAHSISPQRFDLNRLCPCGRFATFVFPLGLRFGDSFVLPLQHQFPLEAGDRADDG